MSKGRAIKQTWKCAPYFLRETRGVTMLPGGPGELIDCLKCEKCGWSMTYNADITGDALARRPG